MSDKLLFGIIYFIPMIITYFSIRRLAKKGEKKFANGWGIFFMSVPFYNIIPCILFTFYLVYIETKDNKFHFERFFGIKDRTVQILKLTNEDNKAVDKVVLENIINDKRETIRNLDDGDMIFIRSDDMMSSRCKEENLIKVRGKHANYNILKVKFRMYSLKSDKFYAEMEFNPDHESPNYTLLCEIEDYIRPIELDMMKLGGE